jgi:uncharacterized protein (TIGR03435 family)
MVACIALFASLLHAQISTVSQRPQPLRPLASDVSPAFEVATIKPSDPNSGRRPSYSPGQRQFSANDTTVRYLMQYAYGVQARQVAGGPAWLDTDKYDIAGIPEGEGQPSVMQWKIMLQKLLSDRFELAFHRDTQQLPVYALVLEKGGAKLAKGSGESDRLQTMALGRDKDHAIAIARNANMADFTGALQRGLLDRPVLDRTDLEGRFDFTLNFTPDESQAARLGGPLPAGDNAPPGLFTAIQEQLGLKLESTRAAVEVLVIDRVERPSEN